MTALTKKQYPEKWITVGDLSIRWAKAQRGLDQRKVDQMEDEGFDPDAFGSVVVTKANGNGQHHVVDGQHRVALVKQMWGDDQRVPCRVLDVDDPKRAADIWLKINDNRTRPQPVEKHKVAVTAGREDNVAVQEILDDLGYKVCMDGMDGSLSAITACLNIYRKHGGPLLRDTLQTIQDIWGMQRDSVNNGIVRGMSEFLAEYGHEANRERLAEKVAKKYTPARILGAAKALREAFHGTVANNVATVLLETYNHALRSNKLGGED